MVCGCLWSKRGRVVLLERQRCCSPECGGGGRLGQRGRSGDGTVEMPTRASDATSRCDHPSPTTQSPSKQTTELRSQWPPH